MFLETSRELVAVMASDDEKHVRMQVDGSEAGEVA